MRHGNAIALLVVGAATVAEADDGAATVSTDTDLTDASLEELLNTDLDVASKVKQPYREVPGVITVVTREEIMDSGARSLEDVLLLVPGFSVGVDVQGAVNVGVRGLWGHEGKVLLRLDGQQMNETLYSTNQLGNHFPVDQIERIEIIRGPGSAIYGGFAELAVINIVTRGADELHGVAAYGSAGLSTNSYGHANLSVAAADNLGPVAVSLSGFLGMGHPSDKTFTDFYGSEPYSLTEHTLDPGMINFGATYRDLSFRFIYDGYRAAERDGLGQAEVSKIAQSFQGIYSELAYKLKPRKDLVITPKINFTRQLPWRILDPASPVFYDKTAQRITGGALASWDATKALNLVAGAEAYLDKAWLNQPAVDGTAHTQFGSADSVTYTNEAVYAQALFNHAIANVTAGARFEHHSNFGNSFVPRVAITKVANPFHFKLLYSEAFRAPGFENINLAADPVNGVTPEKTRVFEGEVGMAIDAHNFLAVNAVFTNIKNPIVYFVDDSGEGYQNFPRTGTSGIEADYKLRYKWGYAAFNYSYYRALSNQIPTYAVEGHSDLLVGMPQHKATLHGAVQVWKRLRIAPSVIASSGPYAYTAPSDGMGVGTLTHTDPTLIVNVFASYADLGVKGFEAGIGAYNLLDSAWNFYQPYDGGHAPMRGAPRQLLLRLGYTKPF